MMKGFLFVLSLMVAITFGAFVEHAHAVETQRIRIIFTGSADGETPIQLTEVEFLYDHDDDDDTDLVDATESDLHNSVCGWDCDSALTNRSGTPSSELSGVLSHRQVRVVYDNNYTTYFTVDDNITEATPWNVQYTWYLGSEADDRNAELNIEGYTITVPVGVESTAAPNSWRIEYFDVEELDWIVADTETGTGVDFSDGTAITNVDEEVIARKLTFTLD